MNPASNPLLEKSSLPHGAVPFDRIRDEHFEPAFDASLAEARAMLKGARNNPAEATFENTIEVIEFAVQRAWSIDRIFRNLHQADTNPRREEIAKKIFPKSAAFINDLTLDSVLFSRVESVYQKRESLELDPERKQLLEQTHRKFVRNGARLNDEDRKQIREIDGRLAVIQNQFSENVLKATNQYVLWIESREDLAGLPESAIGAAAHTAAEKGNAGKWAFTLQQPSLGPFMRYSDRRDLREKLWKASNAVGTEGAFDNRALAIEVARLKHERARLLGFKTFAEYELQERMAETPERVEKFSHRLIEASRAAAARELEELRELAGHEIQYWDVMYYSQKLRKKKLGLDEEMLRPYLALDNVVSGMFEMARRLYGLEIKPRTDVPVYHPEVRVYEITDHGRFLALFYTDFFPRASKGPGAWMSEWRSQGLSGPGGQVERALVMNVCNFSPPVGDRPSLLSYDEVRTAFHEFGHALHSILSECRYPSLSGVHVYRDFVELPSQVHENWMRHPDGVRLFARHYQTGEPMPAGWLEKLREEEKFMAGWASMRQLDFGAVDWVWYATPVEKLPRNPEDVERFERDATQGTRPLQYPPGTVRSASFKHIFAYGYSAGYYSYKWAEALDADAFEEFEEKGIFDRETAKRFRDHVMSRGGTEHPMTLYKRFRGKEPGPEALLRRSGLS